MKKEPTSQTVSHTDHDHNYNKQIFSNMIYAQPNLKKSLLKRFSTIFIRELLATKVTSFWKHC